ncbi:transcriptional regulator [bacterium]|nr:MAG: transcriptional regulator [bacterium]
MFALNDRLLLTSTACHALNMDALDISYRLKRLGKTQSEIARDLGVRQGVVSNVIHDRATAHSVASYIAELLGMRVEELWPDRYCFKPRAPTRRTRPVENRISGEVPQ